MAKNICTPQDIFGPFRQHLFCGCSVMSFSASVGWNSQQGECTVQLVEDECSSTEDKIYFNQSLIKLTTTSPDPGFTSPSIGAPAMFRVEDFEYAGLIQSWKETNSVNGKPTFEVKLVDPREILAGAQVIVGEYAGAVTTATVRPYNVINAFGYMEAFGVVCPERTVNGATFGTPAGGFGGAKVNENGMAYERIRQAISVLTSSIPKQINQWSAHGRLVFKGANPLNYGYGVMLPDLFDFQVSVDFPNHDGYLSEYYVDLSELPTAPEFYRIRATSISLLDLIQQVCTEAGCDFYIELIPIRDGVGVAKFIKVRVVSRAAQPLLGEIQNFISNSPQGAEGVIDNSIGRELRNEDTTSFLIGGKVQSIYQSFNSVDSAVIEPYWGLDSVGNVVTATVDGNGEYVIPVDLAKLNNQLFNTFPHSTGELTEGELRTALHGYDEFLTYALALPTDLGDKISANFSINRHKFDGDHVVDLLAQIAQPKDKLAPRDLISVTDVFALDDGTDKDLEVIYEWVANFAREYYGKKFQVHMPFTCAYQDLESNNYFVSEEPTQEGGWTELATVISLSHPNLTQTFDVNSKGLLGPFVRFSNATGIEYPDLTDEEFIFDSTRLYVQADVENEFVYSSRSTFTSPRSILTLSSPVFKKSDNIDDINRMGEGIVDLFNKIGAATPIKMKELMKQIGNQNILYGEQPKPCVPDAAAVPIKSNISTYGPWVIKGPAGKVQISQDNTMVPWEFGSEAGMNTAGLDIVTKAVTFQQVGENGTVTIPGYPDFPLGAEIGAKFGGFFDAGLHLIENRALLSDEFGEGSVVFRLINFGIWNGTYGPNVTNIQVQVGPQGVQTSYTMRTFTPQFGRFSKSNVEFFRKIGRERLEIVKSISSSRVARSRVNAAIRRAQEQSKLVRQIRRDRGPNSPVDLFVGQQLFFPKTLASDDQEFRRNIVEALPYREQEAEYTNYEQKAFMSMDGLIRPLSKDGDAGLPQYVTKAGTQCEDVPHQSEQPNPPVESYTPAIINIDYLDPVFNPADTKHGTSDGHDIDVLGRGSSVPASSLAIPIDKEGGGGYASDYRFFGLRGPLLMTGWGFDLQGKPIPNKADTEVDASGGIFTDVSLKDTFFDDWLRKSHTWPVAPVDLRYDRKRGVWTVPTSFRIIHVTADSEISVNSSGLATPTNLPTLYDANGSPIASPKVTVTAPFSNIPAGSKFPTYFDTNDCTYYPLAGSGSIPSTTGIRISDIDCNCLVNLSDQAINHFVFGTGIGVVLGTSCTGVPSSANTYTIQSDILIAKVSDEDGSRFTRLSIGSGLDLSSDGCEFVINNALTVGNTGCNTGLEGPFFTPSLFETLIFGTGLKVTQNVNEFKIDGGFVANDTDDVVKTRINEQRRFGTIVFGEGLVVENRECSGLVSVSGITGSGVKISNDGCLTFFSSPALADVTATNLTFGSGLAINQIGANSYRIDSPNLACRTTALVINNTADDADITVERFCFGTGMALNHVVGNCEALISPYLIIRDIDCNGSTTTGRFLRLSFGSGLNVTDLGANDFLIDGGLIVENNTSVVSDAITSPIRIDKLQFGKGLVVEDLADCQALISVSGASSGISISNDGCLSFFSNPALTDQLANRITFGSGLVINQIGNANFRIDAPNLVCRDSNLVVNNTLLNVDFAVERFCFGTGMAVNDNMGSCEALVGPDLKIKDINCAGSTILNSTFFSLSFGTGLPVKDLGLNRFRIDGGVILEDSALTVSSPISSAQRFEKLNFGNGLDVEDLGDCEALISSSASAIRISDIDCQKVENLNFQIVDHLIFGTGLDVSLSGGNSYYINGGLIATHEREKKTVSANDFGDAGPTRIDSFTLGSGFQVYNSAATCGIEIIPDLKISNETCQGANTIDRQPFYELKFAKGLKVSQDGASHLYRIDGGLDIETGTDCPVSGPSADGQNVSGIRFHDGFQTAVQTDTCFLDVGARTLAATITTCPLDTHPISGFTTLQIAKGIKADQIDPCTLAIGSDLKIVGCDGTATQVHTINLGCGLDIDTGSCDESTLILDPTCNGGSNTDIPVVTGVFCVGADLIIQFTTFRFNSCGLFVGLI